MTKKLVSAGIGCLAQIQSAFLAYSQFFSPSRYNGQIFHGIFFLKKDLDKIQDIPSVNKDLDRPSSLCLLLYRDIAMK